MHAPTSHKTRNCGVYVACTSIASILGIQSCFKWMRRENTSITFERKRMKIAYGYIIKPLLQIDK